MWAWGDNSEGQLGNAPAATPVTRPVNTIGAGSGITQIAAGGEDMVALKSDGTVLAWGDNRSGELGIGTTAPVAGPVQVTGLTGATQVAAGAEAGFAVHVVPLTAVPDLTGDTQARAGQVLQAAGLVLGTVTKVTDKYCTHLGVMSQGPARRDHRQVRLRGLGHDRPGSRERMPVSPGTTAGTGPGTSAHRHGRSGLRPRRVYHAVPARLCRSGSPQRTSPAGTAGRAGSGDG